MRINTLIECLSNVKCCIISHWLKDFYFFKMNCLQRVMHDKKKEKKKKKEKVFWTIKRRLKIIEYINFITFIHRILDSVNAMIRHA